MIKTIVIAVIAFFVCKYLFRLFSPPEIETSGMRILRRCEEKFRDKDPESDWDAQDCYLVGCDLVEGITFSKDVQRGLFLLQRSANFGNINALLYLGQYYFKQGLSKDNADKMIECYRKAAELGNEVGMYRLGLCLARGIGVEQDQKQAVMWFRKAAEKGYKPIQDKMDELYKKIVQELKAEKETEKVPETENEETCDPAPTLQTGIDLKKPEDVHEDVSNKINLSKESPVEKVWVDPDYESSKQKLEAGDVEEALKLLRRSADREFPPAMYELGTLLLFGGVLKPDHKEGTRLICRAAELGFPEAVMKIGTFYLEGNYGYSKDIRRAYEYFEKAANMGESCPEACHLLGVSYLYGHYVAKDYQKAFQYLERAAALKDGDSLYFLGRCYFEGDGVAKDLGKARELYEKAAEYGSSKAASDLATIYLMTKEFGADPKKGVAWLNTAIQLGDPGSCRYMGILCSTGEFVPKDVNKAVEYYRKAADAGDSLAMILLASTLHDQGKYREEMMWLKNAANLGDQRAIDILEGYSNAR